MAYNIFLHFLNKEANDILNETKFIAKKTQMEVLEKCLKISILLCEDYCIAPPGFLLELPISTAIGYRNIEFLTSGAFTLARKESTMEAFVEKKRYEYSSIKEQYQGLFNDKYILELASSKPFILLRKTSIGFTATKNWEQGPDTIKIWNEIKNKIDSKNLKLLLDAPNKLLDSGIALTWDALQPFINPKMLAYKSEIRNLLQNNYFSLYTNEYNLIVLKDIPIFSDEFNLPTIKQYSYKLFSNFLDIIELHKILDTCPSFINKFKLSPEFIELKKHYFQITDLYPTVEEMNFFIKQVLRKKKRIPFKRFSKLWVEANNNLGLDLSNKNYQSLLDEIQEMNFILNTVLNSDKSMAEFKEHLPDNSLFETIVIGTANIREFKAINTLLKKETAKCGKSISINPLGQIPHNEGFVKGLNKEWRVLLIQADDTSGSEALDLIRRILNVEKTKGIYFVGCAALLNEKYKPKPNLVFSVDRAYDSDKKEISDKGTEYDKDSVKSDPVTKRILELLNGNDAFKKMKINFETRRHFISGSSFSKSNKSEFRKDLKDKFNKDAVVYEMEAYHIIKSLSSIALNKPNFRFGVIKGISDFGDNEAQTDKVKSQRIATTNAGKVFFTLLKNME